MVARFIVSTVLARQIYFFLKKMPIFLVHFPPYNISDSSDTESSEQ